MTKSRIFFEKKDSLHNASCPSHITPTILARKLPVSLHEIPTILARTVGISCKEILRDKQGNFEFQAKVSCIS